MILPILKSPIAKVVLVVGLLFLGLIVFLSYRLKLEGLWFVFPNLGSIRVSTVVIALLCFLLVLFLTRKNGLKSIYYSALTPIFSLGLYELVWYNIGVVLNGWNKEIGSL
jgi:hypothetical protein